MSRNLDDLEPSTRVKAIEFKAACDILIYCTYRSEYEQAILYAQGRTTPGNIVTNAKPGQSWHNYRRAFDWVPMIGGKPQWDNKVLYLQCGEIAESIGLEWAGRWTGKLKETCHCQFRNGLTLEQARAEK